MNQLRKENYKLMRKILYKYDFILIAIYNIIKDSIFYLLNI